ncbi:MAG TPA: metal ABC transporter ATP-binding protein [Clostridia bacterium]|jgi:zinc transport system ATP-binding protein|nr:metal ABC transporter ATP-binding protein [Clostridia bacterium]
MKDRIIQLKKVTFAYPGNPPVLEEINLEIKTGEFVIIFGPNGSAKTTLLKIMLGLLTPQKGTVKIGSSANLLPTISYLPQKTSLNKSFPATVWEVLELTSTKSPAQINTVLKKLKLQEKSKALLGTLSGGQLQRVFLARTLLNNPQIIFLDEPTNNLDAQAQEKLYPMLHNLHRKGITILTVTHDLKPVLNYASRFLLLNQKKTIEIAKENLSVV